MNRSLMISLVVVALAASGCNDGRDYSGLDLLPVTGQVKLDGKPLPGAFVLFEGDDGLGASATTDSGGNYTLQYDSERTGCPPGPKTVKITTAGADEEGADPDSASGEKIPARYNRATTLKAGVSETNTTFNFDLNSTP